MAPELCSERVPRENRGRRESRVRAAPAVSCARCTKENAHEHTGSAEAIRPSLRNGFNGFLRALLGDRAFLPPSPAKTCFRRLDASVGASGPHDFAVRRSAARLASPKHPPHPAPTFVTTRTSLLSGRDAPDSAADLGEGSTASGCGRLARRAKRRPLVCVRLQAIADIAGLFAGPARSRMTKPDDGKLMDTS